MVASRIVKLNVDGTHFLQQDQNFVTGLLSGNFKGDVDQSDAYFIDRDPKSFAVIYVYILDCLRHIDQALFIH